MASAEPLKGGTVTALEVQKRNKNRVNVFIDEEYALSLTLDEAARLRKGQVLTDADVERLQGDDEVTRAVDSGARFLSHRPRSVQEVRRNLVEKEFQPSVVDEALERLTTLGYLDDRAFAEFWLRDRGQFKPLSTRALRYELRQKGVSDAILGELLADQDEEAAAYQAAQQQLKRLYGKSPDEVRQKLIGFLQRRGFSFSVAKNIMRQLETEGILRASRRYAADDADGDDLPNDDLIDEMED